MHVAPLHLILVIAAFLFFGISVWQWQSPYWNRFVSLGLAALTLSMLVTQ